MSGSRPPRYWVVIPSTGGAQTGSRYLKHYLEIAGKSVLEWSIGPFLQAEWIDGVILMLPRHDTRFPKIPISRHPKIITVHGGNARADSVLAGLRVVESMTANIRAVVQVLVHDALRPCLTLDDVERLCNEADEEHGGLLATPLTDELRRASRDRAGERIATQDLWRVQSPQLFRLDRLIKALEECQSRRLPVDDEVAVMQSAGYRPRLVRGRQSNVKLTHPEDLVVAEFWLSRAEYLR